MPDGKPAGMRCKQLTDDNLCRIFGKIDRPAVCSRLRPHPEMCGDGPADAMAFLAELERSTLPDKLQGETTSLSICRFTGSI